MVLYKLNHYIYCSYNMIIMFIAFIVLHKYKEWFIFFFYHYAIDFQGEYLLKSIIFVFHFSPMFLCLKIYLRFK